MSSLKRLPRIAGALLAALVVTLPEVALATADGPDRYDVTGLTRDEVLDLRAKPSHDAEKIGQIAHDARGLESRGCIGSPSIEDWLKMGEQEREESRKQRWCRIRHQDMEGWVAGRFLKESTEGPN
jgi:hypothetical protein